MPPRCCGSPPRPSVSARAIWPPDRCAGPWKADEFWFLPSCLKTSSPPAEKGIPVMDLKLEVIVVPVSDVDRAKQFYATAMQCREDADAASNGWRVVQM